MVFSSGHDLQLGTATAVDLLYQLLPLFQKLVCPCFKLRALLCLFNPSIKKQETAQQENGNACAAKEVKGKQSNSILVDSLAERAGDDAFQ